MPRTPRREFLQHASLGVAAASTLAFAQTARAGGAQDKIVMGVIGCGGQGTAVFKSFASQPDVELAYVCDVDQARAEAAAVAAEQVSGKRPQVVGDLRKILDDDAVDAVIVATPDHWHGPATILACQASKHVYVEKPCAHNVREGRLMVEAARKHRRIVQVGTQSRSTPHVMRAMELLREGAIGKVLVAKAWNSQKRQNIGHGATTEPPAGFDFDAWTGPAPLLPFQANRQHHYHWHWWYEFGTGDAGNDGVHDIDIARWGLGVNEHPSLISGSGGKYYFDDDQQFPDTLSVTFDYLGDGAVGNQRQLIFEQRIWSPYRQETYENGNAFYGTEGMMLLGKNEGFKLYGPRNKLLEEAQGKTDGPAHHRNFLDCIKADQLPNADIAIGHLSAALCHLGNLTARVKRSLRFDPTSETIQGDDEAAPLVSREYRAGHWAVPKDV